MKMQTKESCNWNNLIAPMLILTILATPCNATTASTAQVPETTQVPDYVTDPLLEEVVQPISDAELGGIGCLIASSAVSGSMLYLMGGVGVAFSSMAPPIHPAIVLEGSAAIAFVLSSACYIGVALAPVAVGTYNSISNQFAAQEPPLRPLFAPGELLAIGSGTAIAPPLEVIAPQPSAAATPVVQ